MSEEWRNVPGYEGFYEVSDQGRVRGVDRKVITKKGERDWKGKLIKASDSNGYLLVQLSKNNKNKNYLVHQLVAMAFLGHKPCGHEKVVDHINRKKKDNRAENLRLVSPRENASNTSKKYTSQYIGVSRKGSKWVSNINFNGVKYNLGSFDKEEQASWAYQEALSLYNFGFPGEAVVSYLKSSGLLQGSIHFNKYNTTSWDEDKGLWVSYITLEDEVMFLGGYEKWNTARGVLAYYELGGMMSGSRTEEELLTFMRTDGYTDFVEILQKKTRLDRSPNQL